MKKIEKIAIKHLSYVFAVVGATSLVLGAANVEAQGFYQIVVDGQAYGSYMTQNEAAEAVVEARKKANDKVGNLVLSDFSFEIKTTDKKSKTPENETVDELCQIMLDNQLKDIESGYVLKLGGYSVMLKDRDAVFNVLDRIVDIYDTNNEYSVLFEDSIQEGQNTVKAMAFPVTQDLTGNITSMSFAQEVVAVQSYGVTGEEVSVDDAVAAITAENRVNMYVTQREQYTEEYSADVQYIEEEDWYTSQKEVVQEGSTGIHNVTAMVTYLDGVETGREIIEDNVVSEPSPKIVKIGVKERPTFIKPLRGGSFSSGFGKRWGRRHEGVDWACSVGTKISASCKGTVTYAGWQNGYGNTIVISHGNGLKTRYAHLSKIAVTDGKSVEQGDLIGYSGNTGNSTGPHLHFEVLLDGEPVNPMNYL